MIDLEIKYQSFGKQISLEPEMKIGDVLEKALHMCRIIIYDLDSAEFVIGDNKKISLGEEGDFNNTLGDLEGIVTLELIPRIEENRSSLSPFIEKYNEYIMIREDERYARSLQEEENPNPFASHSFHPPPPHILHFLNQMMQNQNNEANNGENNEVNNEGNNEANSEENNEDEEESANRNISFIISSPSEMLHYSNPPGNHANANGDPTITTGTDNTITSNGLPSITSNGLPSMSNLADSFMNHVMQSIIGNTLSSQVENNGPPEGTLNLIQQMMQNRGDMEDVKVVNTEEELKQIKTAKFEEFKNTNQFNGESCSICLSEFEDPDILMILGCEHFFHQECAGRWLGENKNICPVCRERVFKGMPKDL